MKKTRINLFSYAIGFIISCAPVTVYADSAQATEQTYSSPQEELVAVSAKIADLKEKRKTYSLRAAFCGREADRVMTLDWLAYKRYVNEQIRYQDLVSKIDVELQQLEARQKELQKKVGSST